LRSITRSHASASRYASDGLLWIRFGVYQRGGTDLHAEQLAREAVIEALPIEEQRRIYELFYQAGLRAKAGDFSQPAIATTVSNGSDNRIDDECAAASA